MRNMMYVKYVKNGVTNNKNEGDGKTPLGKFAFGIILSRKSDIQNLYGVKHKLINDNLYWIDDVKSQYYNRLVDVENVKKKTGAQQSI